MSDRPLSTGSRTSCSGRLKPPLRQVPDIRRQPLSRDGLFDVKKISLSTTQKIEKTLSNCRVVGFPTPVQFTHMPAMSDRPAVAATMELASCIDSRAESHGHEYRPMTGQTPLEELANTLSAALGVAGALGFSLALLWHGDATVGQWVFAMAVLAAFLTSTVYHALMAEPAKEVARILDHVAIFILIAATYTPFALGPLRTHGGIVLFALEWLFALTGLCFVLCGGHDRTHLSNALYIGMGWLGLFFLSALIHNIPPVGNGLILAGGVCYTAGVAFYRRQWRFSHLVWHLFVLAGAICHALAVYGYSGWAETLR
jgi:hemolysin III